MAEGAADVPPDTLLRLLRESPAFATLWASRAISFIGDGVSQVALVLLAARSGPKAVGLVLLANTLPRLLGPVTGAVADRFDQRRLMAGTELAQAAVFTALAVLLPSLALLLPLVALAGLLATVFAPAGKSAVPTLVPPGRLGRANALIGTAFNLQIVAGPAIGGLLVGAFGTRTAFAVDAATFLLSALLLLRLPPLRPDPDREPATLLAETTAGLRYAFITPLPRRLLLATVLMVSFAAMDNVALVFLVQKTFGGSATAYGVVVACFGVGMLAGSILLLRVADRWRADRVLAAGFLTTAVATPATGLAPALGVAAVAQAVAGGANSLEVIATDTLVQQRVPAPLRGRLFGAVSTSAQVGSGVAYAVGGPLVAAVGPRTTFVIAGAGAVAGLGALLPLLASRD